jgi:hypothetical protein
MRVTPYERHEVSEIFGGLGDPRRHQRVRPHGPAGVRAAWGSPEFEFAHINELHGDAEVAAHLLMFDSVHGGM